MKPTIELQATIDSVNRRKDRSVSLKFSSTVELPTNEFAALDQITPSTGWLLFSPNKHREQDIPQEEVPENNKSQAQRIRSVLFLAWKQNTDQTEDFNAYYRRRTERYIDHLKKELE